MSEKTVITCDQTGVAIEPDQFRLHAVLTSTGAGAAVTVPGDFASTDALIKWLQENDPQKAWQSKVDEAKAEQASQ